MGSTFVLGELIGVGGMARVYAASGVGGARLAVKVLSEPYASDAQMVARLGEEAEAAARLDHHNVVRVHAHGALPDGTHYIVMDRAPGMPLGRMIRRHGALSLARFRTIALQVLGGVAAIHRAGLVHGDLKSDNILVDPDHNDRVTIIDFGLAQAVAIARGDGEALLCGTPEYMAPELVQGEPPTIASDLYAVGITLYEMLTGATPFDGESSTIVLERQLHDVPVPPSLRCTHRILPAPFEAVVLRALAKDPAARPHDADMYATAIDRVFPVRETVPFDRDERSSFIARATAAQADTRDFTERGLARGSRPNLPDEVAVRRGELAAAFELAIEPDAIAETYLALVQALVTIHDLPAAVRELETAVAWSGRAGVSARVRWPLVLSLAAAYDGVGEHDAAWRYAKTAREVAIDARSWLGESRANALVRRLETTLRTRVAPARPARVHGRTA